MAQAPTHNQALKQRAYHQGYRLGRAGIPISRADWEVDFLEDYFRGHNEGTAARERDDQ